MSNHKTITRDIILTDVRLSYSDLWKPKVFGDGQTNSSGNKPDPKFGATALLDKVENKDQITKLGNLIAELKREAFPGYNAPLKHQPLRDGSEKPETEGYGDGIKFIRASGTKRPVVVGRSKQPVAETDKEAPYAGCYVDMKIQLWSQVFMGGKQINASLIAVRFVRDGTAFSGVKFDAAEFRDLEGDSSGATDETPVDDFSNL